LLLLAAAGAYYYFFVRAGGPQANGMSYAPALSADGDRVAFHSEADNLVPGDGNKAPDVFVKDLESGEMLRASQSVAGEEGDAGSYNASIDADGRLVVFTSDASNLVSDDDNICVEDGRRFNCPDIFLKDLESGEVERVSTGPGGEQANWKSEAAAISADGRYVAFSSYASNLVPGDTALCSEQQNTRNCSDIFLKDLETGAVTLLSAAAAGEPGDGDSFGPSISADGRFVAFHSRAGNLVPGESNGVPDVYVKDTLDGSIERVSEVTGGIGGLADSYNASISADGRLVAFISAADNLVPGDANGREDIFVRDMESGVIKLVSISASGVVAGGNSSRPAMAGDGGSVAFDTTAASLYPGDTARCGENDGAPSCSDVLLKDLGDDSVLLVSGDSDGAQGNWNSYSPSVSADGALVAFASEASNLVRGDRDACSDATGSFNCSDIFLREIASGKVTRISVPARE